MTTEEIKRWLKSLLMALVIFAAAFAYLYFRRGLFGINNASKAFAYTAALLAGITLLIGPLLSVFKSLASLLPLRKQLGLTAFGAASIHVIISLFFIDRFDLAWYLREWVPIMFGITAIGVWIFLTLISQKPIRKKLDERKWRVYQSWGGRIAFFAIYLHLIHLKYSDWVLWWTGQLKPTTYLTHPTYVPESLFIFVIMTAIIVYRFVHDLFTATNTKS